MKSDAEKPDDGTTEATEAEPIAELMQSPVTPRGDTPAPSIPGLIIANVAGASDAGRPLVEIHGRAEVCEAWPVWMDPEPDWAHCQGLKVVLGFENADAGKPLVVGVIGTPARLKEAQPADTATAVTHTSQDIVKITSDKELVLQCGKAKIALRADGRIAILGGYVLSRSTGVNKIKGGSVQIN